MEKKEFNKNANFILFEILKVRQKRDRRRPWLEAEKGGEGEAGRKCDMFSDGRSGGN